MLQTQTPGGEPTQSCQEKGHVPRDGREGARPSQGAQLLPTLLAACCRHPRAVRGSQAHARTRAPSPGPRPTDPVCHGPQEAVQVADQSFGWGTRLLHGQAGEGSAAVVEGEVTALEGWGMWGASQGKRVQQKGPKRGGRSLSPCAE